MNSDQIPPPFSEEELRKQWNEQADEFNQWDSLDSSEQLAWAQARAHARALQLTRPAPLADESLAGLVSQVEDLADWQDQGTPEERLLERVAAVLRQQQAEIERLKAPPAPAAGEVAELVAALQADAECVAAEQPDLMQLTDKQLARAAELLQQQHPTPVPVSEGLPGAADIHFEFVVSDADYCTQAGGTAPTYAQALSEGQRYLAQYQEDGPHTLELRRIEVLHPGALPVHPG